MHPALAENTAPSAGRIAHFDSTIMMHNRTIHLIGHNYMTQDKMINGEKLTREELKTLLDGSPAENLKPTDEDRQWLDDSPKGKELI